MCDWIAGEGNARSGLQFNGVMYTLMVRCRHEVDGGDWFRRLPHINLAR